MSQSLRLTIKSSILDRQRLLLIEPDLIEFDDAVMIGDAPSQITKSAIKELRYGVKAINGYRLRIGRIYCIDIKSSTGKIIKIRLKSIYQINIKKLEIKYWQILKALIENFIDDICHAYIEQFNKKEIFSILGVKFTQEGIVFEKEKTTITWLDAGSKNYWTYYSIFSLSNPNQYKTFNYLTEWNTIVLYKVSRGILEIKKME